MSLLLARTGLLRGPGVARGGSDETPALVVMLSGIRGEEPEPPGGPPRAGGDEDEEPPPPPSGGLLTEWGSSSFPHRPLALDGETPGTITPRWDGGGATSTPLGPRFDTGTWGVRQQSSFRTWSQGVGQSVVYK